MANSELTKLALANAMKDLMMEKTVSKITVSDITEGCNMNRKSFYYHFKDKYDLVNWIFYTEFISGIHKTPSSDTWILLEEICVYLYKNKDFYCNALKVEGQNCFSDYFIDLLEPFMLMRFGDIFETYENKEFISTYFAEVTRVGITRWLIEDNDISPKRFVELTRTAIEGVAVRVMADTVEE